MNMVDTILAFVLGLTIATIGVGEAERAKADAAAACCYAAMADGAQPAPQPKQTLRVLVFGSEICGPCIKMKREMGAALPAAGWKIGSGAGDDLEFVDALKDSNRAAKYSVIRTPTTVIVDAAGAQVAWIEGPMTLEFFVKWCAEKGKTVTK